MQSSKGQRSCYGCQGTPSRMSDLMNPLHRMACNPQGGRFENQAKTRKRSIANRGTTCTTQFTQNGVRRFRLGRSSPCARSANLHFNSTEASFSAALESLNKDMTSPTCHQRSLIRIPMDTVFPEASASATTSFLPVQRERGGATLKISSLFPLNPSALQ